MSATSTRPTVREDELLEAARGGDQQAFGDLLEPRRAELHAHCYRMLGSVHDARGRASERPASRVARPARPAGPRVAAHLALPDRHQRLPRRDRAPPQAGPEACYEQREAVELAFIAALQHLPPRQRAVLILRDVLSFSAREVAEALDTTPVSVNSALQRARKAVDERLPERSQQATLRSLGDERVRDLVERFIDAFEQGEVDAILAMLAEDATFVMPPYAEWCRGRESIAESWLMPSGPAPRLRYVATTANGQPAVAAYLRDGATRRYLPLTLDVLTFDGPLIADVVAFRSPDVFSRFGLPAELRPG
jgi:RNA polymerase sigma-70 factor, ECF subfamily